MHTYNTHVETSCQKVGNVDRMKRAHMHTTPHPLPEKDEMDRNMGMTAIRTRALSRVEGEGV